MSEISKEILAAVTQAAKDKKISCAIARKVAKELNVPVKTIGQAANELGIKIAACELGCF